MLSTRVIHCYPPRMKTENLIKRRLGWYARVVVPPQLRSVVGKRELIKTLQTRDVVEANRRKHQVIADLKDVITKAEMSRDLPRESTEYVLQAACEAHAAVVAGADQSDVELGLDATIENHLELLRKQHGEDSEGDPLVSTSHANAVRLAHKVFTGQKVSLLSNQVQRYLTEVSKGVRKQTVADKQRAIGDFQQWLKHDVEVSTVTRKVAGEYFTEQLMRRQVAPATTRSTLSHVSSLWVWMEGRGIVESNPWEKLGRTIAVSKRGKRAPRRPWTDDELLTLMKSTDKTDPLFALSALEIYTGARREEVCLFRTEDLHGNALIVREGKTTAAVRTVPLHPVIRPLVARLAKQTDDGFLIPGLLTGGADEKRGHYIGKRFGYHIRRIGILDKALCGHALRNSFLHRCEHAGIPETTAKLLVGHSRKSSLTYGDKSGGYSPGLNLPELSKAMAKVSFGPLDDYLKGTASAVKVDANKSHRRK
jgi:integrase